MTSKEDFLRKLEENLDVMDKNIDDMFTRAQETGMQQETVDKLRKQHAQTKKHAEKLRNAADANAAEIRDEAHTAWEDLKRAFATARSRLGD